MKICIVSDLYYPYPGGVSEHVAHIAKELRKLGHTVKILTTNYPKTLNSLMSPTRLYPDTAGQETGVVSGLSTLNSTDVYRIGKATKFWINKSVGIIPVGLNIQKAVKSILEEEKFDIIHLQAPNIFLSAIALKYSRTINVMTFHSSAPEAPWHKYASSILQPYVRKIHGTIAVSKIALETMERFSRFPNVKIIPNGVDIARFAQCPRIKNNDFNILFIGRFEPRKGLKYLISAFPEVRKNIPNANLIAVGGDMPDCKIEGIHFKGRASPDEIPHYFAKSNVFCSPATGSESFGIVLLEAMAAGTPVIASRIPGYQQVITDGKDGILVEPENAQELAQAIVKLYKNKELQEQLVVSGKNTALKYSWDKVVKQIGSFYYEIILKCYTQE